MLLQLQAHQLEPALQFLAHHPAADAIHTAVLPSNCHSSGTALAALSGLQALQLYYARLSPPLQQLQHSGTKAGKAVTKGAAAAALAGPAPELTDLPLQQLSGLTSLTLTLESGDIPSGRKLALPGHLQSMSMSAPALGMAINPLELQSLTALSSLKLSVLDASSSKCLAKLLGLPGLAHLSIGRFWCIPDVLHSMSGLSSLEVALYGHVAQHAALDGLEAALTAAGSGLGNLPARPNLQLQVSGAGGWLDCTHRHIAVQCAMCTKWWCCCRYNGSVLGSAPASRGGTARTCLCHVSENAALTVTTLFGSTATVSVWPQTRCCCMQA